MVKIRVTYGTRAQVPQHQDVNGSTYRELLHDLESRGLRDGSFYLILPITEEPIPILEEQLDNNISDREIYYGIPVNSTKLFDNLPLSEIQLLLDNGADPNIRNSIGSTPLHYAIETSDNLMIVQLLLDKGANINTINNYGSTPLHYAVTKPDNLAMIQFLLSRGADPNVTNRAHNTPLYNAITRPNNLTLVRILLEGGADPTSINNYGEMLVDVAQRMRFNDVAQLLQQYIDNMDILHKEPVVDE